MEATQIPMQYDGTPNSSRLCPSAPPMDYIPQNNYYERYVSQQSNTYVESVTKDYSRTTVKQMFAKRKWKRMVKKIIKYRRAVKWSGPPASVIVCAVVIVCLL